MIDLLKSVKICSQK